MREWVQQYFAQLGALAQRIEATDGRGKPISFGEAMECTRQTFLERTAQGGKLMLIGNGGSAAIASHQAVDYWKRGGLRTVAFNDASLLTCIANDFGYPHVFEKPIEMFADPPDVLVAISSSGNSVNILNGVHAARAKSCAVVTMSGFEQDNRLRGLGDINFYVPSSEYGYVEITHVTILHCLADYIVQQRGA